MRGALQADKTAKLSPRMTQTHGHKNTEVDRAGSGRRSGQAERLPSADAELAIDDTPAVVHESVYVSAIHAEKNSLEFYGCNRNNAIRLGDDPERCEVA